MQEVALTRRQADFVQARATEVLFGGAAGGGKSFGQLADALYYALAYPGSKQLILRRTFAELDKSLIRVSLALFPQSIYRYHATSHTGRFTNGSLLDFGYCQNENDVYQYQSAEYDVVRFDELTHFTEFQYLYLISRVRGANGFPKYIKSSTNPGGVGHAWVKRRFIDPATPNTVFESESGTRLFLPSKIDDNTFLMQGDPDYKERLSALPEAQKRALLYGDWNIFEGQYFSEFKEDLHVIAPFILPPEWRRWRSIDYGLDRLACLWIAQSPDGDVYVYREFCQSNLIISDASRGILERDGKDKIYATLAPPDLFNRSQETGKSKSLLFAENGIPFTKAGNDRECGWLSVKELLKVRENGTPRLRIFKNCRELICCLPQLLTDTVNPCDTRTEPHDITHAPDALRYFAITHARPAKEQEQSRRMHWTRDMWQDFESASPSEKTRLRAKYGTPL